MIEVRCDRFMNSSNAPASRRNFEAVASIAHEGNLKTALHRFVEGEQTKIDRIEYRRVLQRLAFQSRAENKIFFGD